MHDRWFCHDQTYNNIGDYKAKKKKKIHTEVENEPSLQPIEGEIVNWIPGHARPDIRARGVWRDGRTRFLMFALLTLTLYHSIP